jgi:hypothetical protein
MVNPLNFFGRPVPDVRSNLTGFAERIEFCSDVPKRLKARVTYVVNTFYPDILHVKVGIRRHGSSAYYPEFGMITLEDGDETYFTIGHELCHHLMHGVNYDRGYTTTVIYGLNTPLSEKLTDLNTWARGAELCSDFWVGCDGTYLETYSNVLYTKIFPSAADGKAFMHELAEKALDKYDGMENSVAYFELEYSKKLVEHINNNIQKLESDLKE